MREIKFRGQIKDNKEWVYGTLLIIPAPPVCIGEKKPDTYIIQFPDPRYTPDWNMPYRMVQAEVVPDTIGQYTGLHDKNGKEIYEGDIVKIDFDKAIVEYSEDYSGFILKPIGDYYFDSPMLAHNMSLELEKIGNKWENSELIEGNV